MKYIISSLHPKNFTIEFITDKAEIFAAKANNLFLKNHTIIL